MTRPIRVLVADRDLLAVRKLRAGIEGDREFVVIAEARHGREVIERVLRHAPDLALLAPGLAVPGALAPGLAGLDAVALTRHLARLAPAVRVVLVGPGLDIDQAVEALRAGAAGYVPEAPDPATLRRVLRRAAAGEVCLPRDMTTALVDRLRWTLDTQENGHVVAAGASAQEVAGELAAVSRHIGRILDRLAFRRREAPRLPEGRPRGETHP